ncbi:MAG: hypothetical protein ACI86H_001358 [bacterium]
MRERAGVRGELKICPLTLILSLRERRLKIQIFV